MDKEAKELQKFLSQATKLYKKHITKGYNFEGFDFEDCEDGKEIHEVLIFEK